MILNIGEVTIREANLNDAEILYKWWNDGSVMEHAGFPNGLDITIKQIEQQIMKNTDNNKLLIIEYENKPIGEMSLRYIDLNSAKIGIKICDFTKHGNGLGTKILHGFVDGLFQENKVDRIVLDTNLNNNRARHVYEKIGFKEIKINYNSWKNQLGELQSSVDYELLRKDFTKKAL